MNRALSPAEQQFLSVTWRAARGSNVPDRARINLLARDRLGVPSDWDDRYRRLRQEGLVRLEGEGVNPRLLF